MLDIDAVAFDLDGTLYPNYRFYMRLLPFIVREHKLLRAMGQARDVLRSASKEGRFYELQARIMAEILSENVDLVKERTEKLIYRGWEPLFRKVRLFRGVRETLADLRASGLKLGLLSDFPPDIKLMHLGLADGWDAVLCSELSGRLKPDPLPFLDLARALGTEPSRVLYVGNSVAYDIAGAKAAGMKSALVTFFGKKNCGADLVFSDYRQLRSFVLT